MDFTDVDVDNFFNEDEFDEIGNAIQLGEWKKVEQTTPSQGKEIHSNSVAAAWLVAALVTNDLAAAGDADHQRQPKVVRNRKQSWEFVQSWDDKLFQRQFRISRQDFLSLSEKCKSQYPGSSACGYSNYKLAQVRGSSSTPQSGPISMELKLAITLRILAGANYLDLVWYGVQVDSIHSIFTFTIHLLNDVITDDESFKLDPYSASFGEELQKMADEWSAIMVRKKGYDIFRGTILAGDGLVVPIIGPSVDERQGLDLAAFRNRKGCFAVNVQAFCDAHCRFRYFEVSWPGSTNDITAYKQTNLYRWFTSRLIPEEYHMVLDEAYGSIGGDHHLTPFTKHQLRKAREESEEKYGKLKAFNNFLSGQRITIERAFGIFVRKWGILCKPLEFSLRLNTLLLKVCAKLHNLAIDRWCLQGVQAEQIAEVEAFYVQQRDAGIFMGWSRDEDLYDPFQEVYNDSAVAQLFGNHRPNEPVHRILSLRKLRIVQSIFDKGFRYNIQSDNDFTFSYI